MCSVHRRLNRRMYRQSRVSLSTTHRCKRSAAHGTSGSLGLDFVHHLLVQVSGSQPFSSLFLGPQRNSVPRERDQEQREVQFHNSSLSTHPAAAHQGPDPSCVYPPSRWRPPQEPADPSYIRPHLRRNTVLGSEKVAKKKQRKHSNRRLQARECGCGVRGNEGVII